MLRQYTALWVALAFGIGIVGIVAMDRVRCPNSFLGPNSSRHRIELLDEIPKPGLRDLPQHSRVAMKPKSRMGAYVEVL